MISRGRRLAGTVIASVVTSVIAALVVALPPVEAATASKAKVTTTKRSSARSKTTTAKAKTTTVRAPTTTVAPTTTTTIAPTTTVAPVTTLPAPTTTALTNPFTLTRSIVTRNVGRGTTAKTALEVIYAPGFSGDLRWTASPERDGVTVSFTSNPTRNVVEILVTASATATLGTTIFPMSVTGGGVERQFTVVAIVEESTVSPLGPTPLLPGQNWTATLDNVGQVAAGGSAVVTLRIARSGGFTGPLSVTYVAPIGITVGISQNPVGESALVTVNVALGTSAGTYQVTLLLSSGGSSTTVAFPVQVP
jgi:hypothetical protein